jgi:hypothetical protein
MDNHARDKDNHPSKSNRGAHGLSGPKGRTVRHFWCSTPCTFGQSTFGAELFAMAQGLLLREEP